MISVLHGSGVSSFIRSSYSFSSCSIPEPLPQATLFRFRECCFDQEKQGPCSHEIYLLIGESTDSLLHHISNSWPRMAIGLQLL